MSRHIVVGLGEVLWDIFPEEKRLGGAPANAAYHTEVLGEEGIIVSRVGDDALGSELIRRLAEKDLNTSYIQTDAEAPTGTVEVTVTDGEPCYTITPNVAWDQLEWTHELAVLATRCDAVCFSTLCQRESATRHAVETFLQSTKPGTLCVLDVNLRPPFIDKEVVESSINLAGIIKYNQDEAAALSEMFEQDDLASWLIEERDVTLVLETKGANGCAFRSVDETGEIPGLSVDTSEGDPVGVGDAFTAAVVHELLRGATPAHAAKFANRYAAIVAKKRGGMPEMGY